MSTNNDNTNETSKETTNGTTHSADNNSKEQEQEDDEDWKVQRDEFKRLGDAAFKIRDFKTAIHQYTQAISVDPEYHILYSNRSAAYLSASEKSKALWDAQKCVECMPREFFKGYSRLAAALQSLGRYQQAIETWQKVLKADANNAAAKQGLDVSTKAYEEQQEKLAKEKQEEEKAKQQQQQEADNAKKEEKKDAGGGDGDDLLDDFFNDVETAVETVKETKQKAIQEAEEAEQPKATNAIKSHKKDLKNAQYQIDRLLADNYKWRNLNPFWVLDLDHTATEDDISRRYKALSLLLHPDKNTTMPRAQEAYDEVQNAKNKLKDEHKANHVRQLCEQGMKQGTADWNNASNKQTPLEELQTKAIQKIFAQIEYKRREVEQRQKNQEARERQQEQELEDKEKKEREFNKNWKTEERVEKRIGNWRDFSKTSKKSKK